MQEKEGRRKERTFECKLESTEQGARKGVGGWLANGVGERGQQTSQGRLGAEGVAGNYGANPATLRRREALLVL